MQTPVDRLVLDSGPLVHYCPSPATALRARLTARSFRSPYLTAAEQFQANYHIYDCQNPARFTRWLRNLSAALTRCGAAQHAPSVAQHTASPLTSRLLQPVTRPAYPGNYVAPTRDRRAATHFEPAQTPRYAHLLLAR